MRNSEPLSKPIKRILAVTVFGLLALVGNAQAMERDSWSGPIVPGSLVRIDNPYGDIRLRHGGSENNLEVSVVLQQLSIDGSKLVFEVEITEDTAEVRVVRYDLDGEPAPEVPRGDASRVDLAVLVPEGTTTRAETNAGLIEAMGVRTDVDLHTDRGTIRVVKNRGGITATANGGEIEITLVAGVTKDPQRLVSTTGPISVHTPASNDLSVTMTTSGALITDFSLDVEHHDTEEPNKISTARVGRGGPVLHMSSKRGDLALRRVVTVDTD